MKFVSVVTAALILGASQAVPAVRQRSDGAVAARDGPGQVVKARSAPVFRQRALHPRAPSKRGLSKRGPTKGGRVEKPQPELQGPVDKDKIAETMQEAMERPEDYQELLGQINERPKNWDYKIKDDDFKPDESGILVKNDGKRNIVFVGYGDDEAVHGDHEAMMSERYPGLRSYGYRVRNSPFSRGKTLAGTGASAPAHKDENPPRRLDFPFGMHSVMLVPPGESSKQGTMLQQAYAIAGKDGLVRPFDNRASSAAKAIQGKVIRGPTDTGDRNTPDLESDEPSEDEVKSYMEPIPNALLPKNLRAQINANSNTKRSVKRSVGKTQVRKRDFGSSNILTFAPFYNDNMMGADVYDPNNVVPPNASDYLSTAATSASSSPSKRDIIGTLTSGESNAGDSSSAQDSATVLDLIWAKEVAQSNLTSALQPYIDAVMNGSSNPMAEAMAWNLYSIVTPSVSIISPFMGPGDCLSDMAANMTSAEDQTSMGFGNWSTEISAFNTFVYSRAWLACNATGALQDLYTINAALSAYNQSLWPSDQWTVDNHTTEPFMDYLQQWYDYNEIPFTSTNSTPYPVTPSWILDQFDLGMLNGTSANGTVATGTLSNVTTFATATPAAKRWYS